MKKTKDNYEEYLNELYDRETTLEQTEHCWAGNDKNQRQKNKARVLAEACRYGTVLRKYDPIAFEVGFQDWVKK